MEDLLSILSCQNVNISICHVNICYVYALLYNDKYVGDKGNKHFIQIGSPNIQ